MLSHCYDLPVSLLSTVAVGISLIYLMSGVPHQALEVVAELAPGFYHMIRELDLLLSLGLGVLPGLSELPRELLVELLDDGHLGGVIIDAQAAVIFLLQSP